MQLRRLAPAAVLAALAAAAAWAQPSGPSSANVVEGGPVGPAGQEVACDVPAELRKKNISSRGLGCCVFRSIDHAAKYQSVPALYDFPEWMVQQGIAGGGYPAKVDQLIPKIAKSRGLPTPGFVQHTGGDLSFLYAATKGGRPPSVTYDGHDMHYGWQTRIAHMVSLVHVDPPGKPGARWYAILDNNWIGERQLVWLTEAEFARRWNGGGGGWAVVLLAPPPPPAPRN